VQTERVVDQGNTVAIRDRSWQIDKTGFRNTLAGCTVRIHEHLDETVSIRYGPHVVGRYDGTGEKLISATAEKRRGTASTTASVLPKGKAKAKPKTQRKAV
jgi:hypothetical protein